MKIIRSNGSQLCNRLWSYAPFIAYSKSFNENIYILDFDQYSNLFPNLQSVDKVHFINNKFITLSCKLYSSLKFKIQGEVDKNLNISKKINGLFINGWDWRRSENYIKKNRNFILKIFSPTELVISKCTKIINEIKNDDSIVVGVHVRRGDYKTFLDGKYYFTDESYFEMMSQIKLLIGKCNASKVKFLITSNENLNWDVKYENSFQIPNSTPIEDLYLLSLCNYIVGPPSSFSMWASWYGSVPLKLIKVPKKINSLTEFKVISTIDIFEDGSII